MKTLAELADALEHIDKARNGEVDCDDIDVPLVPILDALPDIVRMLRAQEKFPKALDAIYEMAVELEAVRGDAASAQEARRVIRIIEASKHWKLPEFDARFLRPELHPNGCTCEVQNCRAHPVPTEEDDGEPTTRLPLRPSRAP